MKRWLRLVLVVVVLALVDRTTSAAEPGPKSYFLAPVKTPLQRSLVPSMHTDAYLQFAVGQVVRAGRLDERLFDRKGLRADLSGLAQQVAKSQRGILVYFRYAGDESLDPKEKEAIEGDIKTICRETGFAEVRGGAIGDSRSWRETMAEFDALKDDVLADESPVEDEFVRVYPVRTRFSRFLLHEPTCDCYITLRRAIDGRFNGFSAADRDRIAKRLSQLALPEKRYVRFSCLTTTSGNAKVEDLMIPRDRPAPIVTFARELGFQNGGCGWVQMGVSPEALLGKPAPDFNLPALAGGRSILPS